MASSSSYPGERTPFFPNSPLSRVAFASDDTPPDDNETRRDAHIATPLPQPSSDSPWDCKSPMTRHVVLTKSPSTSPVAMRRTRSRSFNDYIDHSAIATESSLLIPPLRRLDRFKTNQNGTASSGDADDNDGDGGNRGRNDSGGGRHGIRQAQQYHQQQQQQQQRDQLKEAYMTTHNSNSIRSEQRQQLEQQLEPPLQQRPQHFKAPEIAIHEMTDPNSNPQQPAASESHSNPAWVNVLYGLINATIVLPVLMSFGSIIYRDDAFQPYMPVLIKLTIVSGVVHQVCFSTFSSLPFAVGQVQDAGLIFLSAMSKNIVLYCRENGHDDETLLATTTVGLGCATALLGVGVVIIARLKLASYVQMLPTSVIGGYLAFIGWFCGESGLMLMIGASDISIAMLYEKIQFWIPGVFGGLLIYGSVRVYKHVAILPMSILVLLLLFYGALGLSHTSIERATEDGWIRESEPAPVWYHTWDYLKLDKVVWSALPQLIMTEVGMILVVALSSSLDVAAIELEMKEPLDYNGELAMVGLSNIVSGLTGGYTGSYIFSQSIFSLRAGIRSRLAGLVLAFCQALVIVMPFPILAYVPNFFYGSLLSMICIDLVWEWLIEIRSKVTTAEYLICLATFFAIQFVGVEYGILAGVLIYAGCWSSGVNVGEVKTFATNEVSHGGAHAESVVAIGGDDGGGGGAAVGLGTEENRHFMLEEELSKGTAMTGTTYPSNGSIVI